MKVIFINPSWHGLVSKKGGLFNRNWPPLCLLNCAALLEKEGITAEIIDARAEDIKPDEIIRRTNRVDRVFLTSSPLDRWQCPNIEIKDFLDMLAPLRKDNLYILGAHGTVFPETMLEKTGAVAVIRGEPELTVLELCKTTDISGVRGISYIAGGKVIHNPERPLLDMDVLPIPAYHLINIDHYSYELLGNRLALLETSRGCPFSCIYCFKDMYGGNKYRRKSIENVTRELDYIVNTVRAKALYFIDLEFTLDKDFVTRICEHIISRGYDLEWCCQTRADTIDMGLLKKMKSSGCSLVHYGVETGSEKTMASIDKRIKLDHIERGIAMTREAGLGTACFFMFGFPGETAGDMEATIKFALRLDPDYASFHMAFPFPGTLMYQMLGTADPYPEAFTTEHSLKDLKAVVRRAFIKFYLRPSYILSRILKGGPSSWRKQLRLFTGFLK